MKIIQTALREVREFLYILDILRILIDTIIVFLSFMILVVLLNFPWHYALYPALIAFILLFVFPFRENKMQRVEEKVPELNEQLRTVEDNLDKENSIVTLLNEDVLKRMRAIKTSFFLSFQDVTVKSISILLLSLIIIVLAILNVHFDAMLAAQKAIEPLKAFTVRQTGQEIPRIDLASLREGNLTDIFGNKSLAKLGNKELTLQLNPLQSEINLNEIKDAEHQTFTPPDFPKEIYTSYESAYTENVPKENQKVIKTYFQQITQ